MEKQKAKYTYGILEKQFRNIYDKANRGKGITGELLLQLCESRLDNIVYRMGISKTRDGARQLVSHKHITVNGSIVNIPSYTLRPGDIVSVREKSKSLKAIESSLIENNSEYEWIKFNRERLEGEFVSIPEREQIPENIKNLFCRLIFYTESSQFFAFPLTRPDVTSHNPPGLILPDQGVMVRA